MPMLEKVGAGSIHARKVVFSSAKFTKHQSIKSSIDRKTLGLLAMRNSIDSCRGVIQRLPYLRFI